jgi:polysaccharide transporter, PST family
MSAQKKIVLLNVVSLGFQQGIAIVFPLLVFPYLLRILGIGNFGVFASLQTGVMYFDMLVAFGFGLTATKQIAMTTDVTTHKKIIAAVYAIKFLLFAAGIVLLLCCTLFMPYLQQHFYLLLYAAIYVFGNLLFPDWYFQGIQKMKYCTLITVISKLIALVLLVLWVKQADDIAPALLALAIGNCIAGAAGLLLLLKKTGATIQLPHSSYLKQQFSQSAYVFGSIIVAPFYSSVNIFILQIFASAPVVGAYAIVQKIFSAAGMLISVINTAFFPYLTKYYNEDVKLYYHTVKRVLLPICICFLLLAILQFLLAPFIIQLLAGNTSANSHAIVLLRIAAIGIVAAPFVSFFFQQLIVQHKQQAALKNIMVTAIVNLVLAFVGAYYFSSIGITVVMCLITFFIAWLNATAFYKQTVVKN